MPPGGGPRRVLATLLLTGMTAAWAAAFSWLAVRRHDAFWTGRFDLGNMVQAVWSTTQGRPLETTDVAGRQFVRLGAHVDPLLAALTPLFALWPAPETLLIAQAVLVSLGAVPAFLLGRRWLGDDRLALAVAAVYLLYPPVQWMTVTEFHPVALATPLLLGCVWAAVEGRLITLTVLAVLAALGKEQVGLALAVLGLYMALRLGHRRYGAALAVASLAWVAFALAVVIPHFNEGRGSTFVARYGGASEGGVARALLSEPWQAVATVASYDRLGYVAALLVPLALLPLAAPLVAAAALPELALNTLADYWPQYSIEYQYTAVIVPFVVAATALGLARARRLRRPRFLARALARPGPLAAGLVAWTALCGVYLGPLPVWDRLPLGSDERTYEYTRDVHTEVLARAVALVPPGVPVSAGNNLGAHLSERRRIHVFPVVADADWVIVDRRRPYIADRMEPLEHAIAVAALRARPDLRTVYDLDGVLVMRRVPVAP